VTGIRIGNGYDLHRLVAERPLVLGGVTIPYDLGLAGHSDADAVCHAVTDALLGAAALGDIGQHFPDSEPRWKGADSIQLLTQAAALVRAAGWTIANVDVVVIAERPKLLPFVPRIRENLAAALHCTVEQVSVKGKTNEGVDATGTGHAIATHAVALIQR
jgi:2-C-methyl-D-erythritol 2,4-cyclodiphosphate synthase